MSKIAHAEVGDRVILATRRHGTSRGEILELVGTGNGLAYRIRWDRGPEDLLTVQPPAAAQDPIHLEDEPVLVHEP